MGRGEMVGKRMRKKRGMWEGKDGQGMEVKGRKL